jgi:enoyl-CoA hydratase
MFVSTSSPSYGAQVGHWSLAQHGTIAVATFTRPPRNLMSMAAMSELETLTARVAADDGVDVFVVTGGVPGYFVAHADLDDLIRLGSGEALDGDPGSWARTFALFSSMPQPVIAAVNGQAWGGGCELALACTMRVASTTAHFSQPEVTVGIIPGAGGTQRLPRVVGPGRAAELVLTGRAVDADEAMRIGLVEAVLPPDDFVEHVLAWALPIAQKPRHAIVAAKQALVAAQSLPLDEGLRAEGRLFLECQTDASTLALEARFREGIPPA